MKGQDARDAIRAFSRDTTHWFQYLKRYHIRRWLRNSMGIRRFGIPKRSDKDATPANDTVQTPTQTDIAQGELDTIAEQDARALATISGTDNGSDPSARELPSGQADGVTALIPDDPNRQEAGTDVSGDTNTASSTLSESTTDISAGLKDATKEEVSKGLEKVLAKVVGDSTAKILTKAIPIVGWISLASDIDNFMWNGHLRVVTIALHRAEYASEFATWAGLADQFKAGDLSGTQVNDVMSHLSGLENSNAYQRIYMNQDTGTKIDPSKGVSDSVDNPYISSDSYPGCGITDTFNNLTGNGPTAPSDKSSADYWTWLYRQTASAPGVGFPLGFHQPLCLIHPVLGKLSGVVGSIISYAFNLGTSIIDGITSFFGGGHPAKALVDEATSASTSLITWTMGNIFTPVATGYESDAPLGNAIDAGADVTAQGYGRDTLGEKAISYSDASAQTAMLDASQTKQLHQQGLIASLFNMDYTQSFASRITGMLPATPADAASRAGTTAIAMIANPIKFFGDVGLSFFPTSSADDLTSDPYGIQQYGFDASDLDQDLQLPTQDIAGPPDSTGKLTPADGVINEYDCPRQTNPKIANVCLTDEAAVESLDAGYTSTSVDGASSDN